MISAAEHRGPSLEPFPGFDPLTANYLYCPNQFFDLCLPHHSRGVVRLVAFLLRRTLGWLDTDGNPVEQNIAVTYNDLIELAGISRGAIREALDEALAARFVACVQEGRPDHKDQAAQTARFSLRWDSADDYRKTLPAFHGFYAGDGYRTPIPNAFFDRIVPLEPLAVIKVVGTVLRHTVGYQNQFGGRRSQAPLSYSYIQQYANIGSRRALAGALCHAVQTGYIRCVQPGRFDPRSGERSAAAYGIRWLADTASPKTSSKRIPASQFKKDTSGFHGRSKKDTGSSSERIPVHQFKMATDKTTRRNDTQKQQQGIAAAESFCLLRDAGFNRRTATKLSETFLPNDIRQQIDWLSLRNAKQNPLGMLRKAIEEQWPQPPQPPAAKRRDEQLRTRHRLQEKRVQEEMANAADAAEKRQRLDRKNRLLEHWRALPARERLRFMNIAIAQASSNFMRAYLRKNQDMNTPPMQVLSAMASELSVVE